MLFVTCLKHLANTLPKCLSALCKSCMPLVLGLRGRCDNSDSVILEYYTGHSFQEPLLGTLHNLVQEAIHICFQGVIGRLHSQHEDRCNETKAWKVANRCYQKCHQSFDTHIGNCPHLCHGQLQQRKFCCNGDSQLLHQGHLQERLLK